MSMILSTSHHNAYYMRKKVVIMHHAVCVHWYWKFIYTRNIYRIRSVGLAAGYSFFTGCKWDWCKWSAKPIRCRTLSPDAGDSGPEQRECQLASEPAPISLIPSMTQCIIINYYHNLRLGMLNAYVGGRWRMFRLGSGHVYGLRQGAH